MSHLVFNLLGKKVLSSKNIFYICQNNDREPNSELIYQIGSLKTTSTPATILHYLLKTFFTPTEERPEEIAIYYTYTVHRTHDDKLIFNYNTYVYYNVIDV